ncbi:MAG: hypothetical protein H6807_02295 [Planctomycetes bacterium]|nr:hypothetical protein [Planctomycetota bacterium]
MSQDRGTGAGSIGRRTRRKLAAELAEREEAGLRHRFRAFLDREGLRGDARRLALGEIELDDLRQRLRRFFGFGLACAGLLLLMLSLHALVARDLPNRSPRRGEAVRRELAPETPRVVMALHAGRLPRP